MTIDRLRVDASDSRARPVRPADPAVRHSVSQPVTSQEATQHLPSHPGPVPQPGRAGPSTAAAGRPGGDVDGGAGRPRSGAKTPAARTAKLVDGSLELRDYLRMLRQGWVLILTVGILFAGLAVVYSVLTPKRYESTTTLLVSTGPTWTAADLEQSSQFATQAVATYAQIIDSAAVLGPVAAQLRPQRNVDDLVAAVTVSVPTETTLISVTAEAGDPEQAADLANAAAASAQKIIPTLANIVVAVTPVPGAAGTPVGAGAPTGPGATAVAGVTQADFPTLVRVQQTQRAVEPTHAASAGVKRNVSIGLLIGLTVGLALTIVRQTLDTRIRAADDVRVVTDLPVLGVLPRLKRAGPTGLVARDEPDGLAGEAFRTLRTNLRIVQATGRRCFVFAAATDGHDTATGLANLAWTLAQVGHRVLVVDFDLRHGRMAAAFGLENGPGLSDVLAGRNELAQVMQATDQPRLRVVSSGLRQVSPSDLLRPRVIVGLLRRMEQESDCILLNAPPILANSDAALLSSVVGGAFVTVTVGRTRLPQLATALGVLDQVGASPLGLILTGARGSSGRPIGPSAARLRPRRRTPESDSAAATSTSATSTAAAAAKARPGAYESS